MFEPSEFYCNEKIFDDEEQFVQCHLTGSSVSALKNKLCNHLLMLPETYTVCFYFDCGSHQIIIIFCTRFQSTCALHEHICVKNVPLMEYER